MTFTFCSVHVIVYWYIPSPICTTVPNARTLVYPFLITTGALILVILIDISKTRYVANSRPTHVTHFSRQILILRKALGNYPIVCPPPPSTSSSPYTLPVQNSVLIPVSPTLQRKSPNHSLQQGSANLQFSNQHPSRIFCSNWPFHTWSLIVINATFQYESALDILDK